MDIKTLNLLEFDKIATMVACFAVSEDAKDTIIHSNPSTVYNDVIYAQNLTLEASIVTDKYLLSPIYGFDPVDEIIGKAVIGSTLQMGELLKIAKLIRAARLARSHISSCGDDVVLLKAISEGIFIDESIEKDINIAIISENEMSDNASDKLKAIRRKLSLTNAKLKEKLASYTRTNNLSQYLQDNIVTIRNNRFVLPVKSSFKSFVPGLVHDQSATGSTTFIEPYVVVDLNNEVNTLKAEESAEIEKILSDFSQRVADNSKQLLLAKSACVTLDVIFAKYGFSAKSNCVAPIIEKSGVVKLENARHPLLDKNKVVPVSLELGKDYEILLITGPNTGGKTVCLKTVGLFCVLAYFGLWLPCDSAIINVYDDIYCDIGDEQSIGNELSTFSSHMVNIIDITNKIAENSLVLFDELGGGTDPKEGAALALAILDHVLKVGAKAVVTTHYNELKEFGLVNNRVMNACMQFNSETLAPTFKVIIGMPGSSNALHIASRLGLRSSIIEFAKNQISVEEKSFENLISNAENIRNQALKELEEINKEKALIEQRQIALNNEGKKIESALLKIKSGAAVQSKKLVLDMTEKANDIISQMQELLEDPTEGNLLELKKLRSKLNSISDEMNREESFGQYLPIDKSKIVVGLKCIIISLNQSATIVSLADKKGLYTAKVGIASVKIPADDIAQLPEKEVEVKKKKVQLSTSQAAPVCSVLPTELKVLGYTVDEAVAYIEPYIYSMYQNDGAKILKVVHGKGTMALAKGLHNYFKNCKMVSEYRYGRYGEGDNGVTFVTIK